MTGGTKSEIDSSTSVHALLNVLEKAMSFSWPQ